MAPKPLVDEAPPFKRVKRDRYPTEPLLPPTQNWLLHQTFNLIPIRACGFESHRGY